MLLAVICLRGLNPKPSYVRRYISQSPASGCWSRSSVTVAYDVGSACRPCATRSAIGRLSQNLRYDKVGFLFENRYAITRIYYENQCSRRVVSNSVLREGPPSCDGCRGPL